MAIQEADPSSDLADFIFVQLLTIFHDQSPIEVTTEWVSTDVASQACRKGSRLERIMNLARSLF